MKLSYSTIKLVCALVFAALCSTSNAQNSMSQEYRDFLRKRQKEYKEFIDKRNQEYIGFLKQNWEIYSMIQPKAKPAKPKPIKPVVAPKGVPTPKPIQIPISIPTLEKPKVPVAPAQPSTPKIPTAPAQPSTPKIPTAPAQPSTPKIPTAPAQPSTPKIPTAPAQPSTPKIPTAPAQPSTPKIPTAPAQPSTPKIPTKPAKPSAPTTTARPIVSSSPVTSLPPVLGSTQRTNSKAFSFYGIQCRIHNDLQGEANLNGVNEKSYARAWEKLARSRFKPTVSDLNLIKRQLKLNDWGVLKLTHKAAKQLAPGNHDDQVLLMHFLMAQAGYDVRVTRNGNNLYLLYPSTLTVFATASLEINGKDYYIYDLPKSYSNSFYSFNKTMSGSTQDIDMHLLEESFHSKSIKPRTVTSKKYGVTAQVGVENSLIEFYKDYPICDYSLYMHAPLSAEVQSTLFPTLRNAFKGKSPVQKINILLDFIQNGFKYQTDGQQFGYEKPFFPDESFYYPACDCEDRSLLFAYIVRHLLGYEVVLLDYPRHIAAAVAIPNSCPGDFFTYNGKKFTVCDPTFINAGAGQTMPNFRSVAPKIKAFK